MPRRFSAGAEVDREGGVHFRVWAPDRRRVDAVLDSGESFAMTAGEGAPAERGYWSVYIPRATAGTRYRFRLDGDERLFPDPASRFQPAGPHGPSQVIDTAKFSWTDHGWAGARLKGQVIYEMHIGTFTLEGTWHAARANLARLRQLGITALEIMPIAEFQGDFGWGYDGVDLFAPYHGYGAPADVNAFIDHAHSLGLAVFLDAVYNHLGPEGNYLSEYSRHYFSDRHTDWGAAFNYDGPESEHVRRFVLDNAAYWISDYHFDGLRLDAIQTYFDTSADSITRALCRRVRAAAKPREAVILAENETQNSDDLRPAADGEPGLDALWNDDFHHTAMVALTGHNDAYYTDYLGSAQELLSATRHGFLYQGQRYVWQKKRRGRPARGLPSRAFVNFLQNHDQIANTGSGRRAWRESGAGRHRALTALLLLGPGTPMLFQGQEWNADAPFMYFADNSPSLALQVREGRAGFLAQFPRFATGPVVEQLANPGARATFEACRLPWHEIDQDAHHAAWLLHHDLLQLRAQDPVISAQAEDGVSLEGAVLSGECFALRFFSGDGDGKGDGDRLLIVNCGRDLMFAPAPEPLLAPPYGQAWTVLWSSENVKYGGTGVTECEQEDGWHIPGHAATLLRTGQEAHQCL